MLRIETGPAGLILSEPDSILMIGALVANRLYGANCPIVVATSTPKAGMWSIDGDELVEAS
jgi:predicted aconitase with swiveling domain